MYRNSVEMAVRSRLRASGLYTEEITNPVRLDHEEDYPLVVPELRLTITSHSNMVMMALGLYRFVEIPHNGTHGRAMTWGRTAMLGPSRAEGMVAQMADLFIDEYLRVNEKSCGGATQGGANGSIIPIVVSPGVVPATH